MEKNTEQTSDEYLGFIALHGKDPGHSSQLTRSYYDSLLIRMNYLDSTKACTKVTLFGEVFDSPICISALSHLKQFFHTGSGMEELGKAAKEMNVIDFVGTGGMDEFKRILDTGAKVIRIIKPFEDTERILEIMRAAEEGGAFAVGMDIDHSFDFVGNIGNCDGEPLCSMTTEKLKDIIKESRLPFVVKGVLGAADAEKCLEAGADAIFVSHHHGLFRYMTPPPMILPEIMKAVKGRIPVIIDGNIESGYDAFKAIALGAGIVAVGRPLIQIVAKQGMAGICEWLGKQTEELKGIMSRSGCRTISDIDLSHITKFEHHF